MLIVDRPLSEIRPYEKNPRRNRDAVKAVADSIREYGFRQPIVVDEDGVILAGHTRFEAAKRLELDTAPVHVAEGLTADQARAYRIMDNRSQENAAWDEELLKFEFEGLMESGFDLDLTGFAGPEINDLMSPEPGGGGDDLIMPPENPVAALGDVWQCGPHRIVCGDATDKAAVEALGFDGYLMVADPPYGVEYDATWRSEAWAGKRRGGAVEHDDFADWVPSVLNATPVPVVYWWSASLRLHHPLTSFPSCRYDVRALIVWRKDRIVVSRGHYHGQYELCLYAVRRGASAHWHGNRKQSTVWEIDSLVGHAGAAKEDATPHSTQKPVECMARPIRNHTKPGGKAYDPFLGSGTTLVAAQQLGRVGYGIEISPAYVDVACQRLEKHVGEPARKLAEV